MCGIAGIYHFGRQDPVPLEHLQRMNSCLIHRGPDRGNIYSSQKIALAMRRLSILDLEGGNQPMASENNQIHLIFNGEIYNHRELREKLEKKGIRFRSYSDTEVILRMYQDQGIECVHEFQGMFAIAIWDKSKDRLLLVRDRLGKKPLVYACEDGRISFSSEIQSLIQAPYISKNIDYSSLDLYLTHQYIPSPWSIFKSIRKLPPAHMIILERGSFKIKHYWKPPIQPKNFKSSFEETKSHIYEKIKESVRLRMQADVALGAFLSGGVDSSIIVACMRQVTSGQIKTFSIGFEEDKLSELPYARQVAKQFDTDHHEFIVKPDMVDVLPKLAYAYGEPFGDSSAVPTYYLTQEAKKHVTVALSGDGGDENFGGYDRYRIMKYLILLNNCPSFIKIPFKNIFPFFSDRGARFIDKYMFQKPSMQYSRLVGIFTDDERERLYTPQHIKYLNSLTTYEPDTTPEIGNRLNNDYLNQFMQIDLREYLPDCLMTKVDIASMRNSIEVRSPFLDYNIVEYASQIPSEWKLKGFSKTKYVLKESFKNIVPHSIMNRKKTGFGLPINQWFKKELNQYWKEIVFSPNNLVSQVFNKKELHKLYDDHQSGLRKNGYRMWVLMMLGLWNHQFIRSDNK